jgi:hypothetical protein
MVQTSQAGFGQEPWLCCGEPLLQPNVAAAMPKAIPHRSSLINAMFPIVLFGVDAEVSPGESKSLVPQTVSTRSATPEPIGVLVLARSTASEFARRPPRPTLSRQFISTTKVHSGCNQIAVWDNSIHVYRTNGAAHRLSVRALGSRNDVCAPPTPKTRSPVSVPRHNSGRETRLWPPASARRRPLAER